VNGEEWEGKGERWEESKRRKGSEISPDFTLSELTS